MTTVALVLATWIIVGVLHLWLLPAPVTAGVDGRDRATIILGWPFFWALIFFACVYASTALLAMFWEERR